MPHREGGTGVARLAELADGYMDAAVRLRMGLEEVRAELETAEDGRRRALEGRAKLLRQMLKEMRDLRQLAEGYYTRPGTGPTACPRSTRPGWTARSSEGVWRMTEAQEVRARAKALQERRREELEKAPGRGAAGPGARPCGWSWPG